MLRTLLLLLSFCLMAGLARAELVIEITRGANDAIPIAVAPFGGSGPQAQDSIANIVRADLERSGRFRPLAEDKLPARPTSAGEVLYNEWRGTGPWLLVGSATPMPDGRYELRFELVSLDRQARVLAERVVASTAKWRDAAHLISDKVFQAITGIRGAFTTQIVYVNQFTQNGKLRYRLELSDADGERPMGLLNSTEPILSPTWSPDGRKVAYVSFESGRPAIFTHDIISQERKKIASFRGLNGAPAWSPDGTKMAMTLSRDGNPEIYLLDLATQELSRLTNHYAIDTEPRWLPDGSGLIFTSDRGGSAQIYRLTLADKSVKRLTFEGNYNGRGDISADGRYLAMVHRPGGQRFQIAVLDLQNQVLSIITQSAQDESPSFSPNGTQLVYATKRGKYGELGIASVDGRFQVRLPARLGEVREPAWSPFRK